jgi:hypothetical protein
MSARPFAWPGADGHLVRNGEARPALCISPDARPADILATAAAMVSAAAHILESCVLRNDEAAGLAQGLLFQLQAAQTLLEIEIERAELEQST